MNFCKLMKPGDGQLTSVCLIANAVHIVCLRALVCVFIYACLLTVYMLVC